MTDIGSLRACLIRLTSSNAVSLLIISVAEGSLESSDVANLKNVGVNKGGEGVVVDGDVIDAAAPIL